MNYFGRIFHEREGGGGGGHPFSMKIIYFSQKIKVIHMALNTKTSIIQNKDKICADIASIEQRQIYSKDF